MKNVVFVGYFPHQYLQFIQLPNKEVVVIGFIRFAYWLPPVSISTCLVCFPCDHVLLNSEVRGIVGAAAFVCSRRLFGMDSELLQDIA